MSPIYPLLEVVVGGLSFISTLWLFKEYAHIHPDRKNFPLKMVLILVLSTLFQAGIIFSIPYIHPTPVSCTSIRYVFLANNIFSLLWPTILAVYIAIYTYSYDQIQAKRFVIKSFLLILILSTTLPSIDLLKNREPNSLVFNTLGLCNIRFNNEQGLELFAYIQSGLMIVSFLIIIICSIKVKNISTKSALLHNGPQQTNPRFFIWYPLALAVSYIPFILHMLFFRLTAYDQLMGSVWRLVCHFAPTLIALVYLKMKRAIRKEKRRLASIATTCFTTAHNRLTQDFLYGTP